MMRLAQVVRVNQARRTVDLVYLDTREPVREALVAGKASNIGGSWDVPSVPLPSSAQATGQVQQSTPSMVAVVADVDSHPMVLGFVPALGNQVAFTDPNREVDRHPSGVVTSVDQFGNIQMQHPGGVTIRIGSPTIENLADVAADGNWNIPAGTPPTVTLITPKASVVIDPATGNMTVTTEGDINATAKDVSVTTSGNTSVVAENAMVTASVQAQVTAPVVLLGSATSGTKRVVVDGDPVVGGVVRAEQNTHVFAL